MQSDFERFLDYEEVRINTNLRFAKIFAISFTIGVALCLGFVVAAYYFQF